MSPRLSRRAILGVLPALAALTVAARAQRAGPTSNTGGASTSGALLAANNLNDVAAVGTARTNLGLGAAAVLGTATAAQAGALSSATVVLTPAAVSAAIAAYLAGLPTTLPSTSGVPWLNGNTVAVS